MNNLKNINDNVIANQWKQRYTEQPDGIKEKLDELERKEFKDYQLQVIKRKRVYPQIGDIFKINPKEDIVLYGIVINNHISNINGEELLVILIFKEGVDITNIQYEDMKNIQFLLPPQIVGKEYWTKGYFYNIDHIDKISNMKDYGFYSIGKGKCFDEYGNEIKFAPQLLGTYGVVTISGIARKINRELIIAGIL